MATGLFALLDDVAALAKLAATSLDDVAVNAAKAGAKAAGVVIDDTAVTPAYVTGISPKRELPMIARIARGSIFNKLVVILPVALLLKAYADFAISPLLVLGGLYLCFEGVEKLIEYVSPHAAHEIEHEMGEDTPSTPAALEASKVKSAVRTDFILSAEIMTITLSAIPNAPIWEQGLILAMVGVGITVAVYGVVGLIVKADDVGLVMARNEIENGALRGTVATIGRSLVTGMPKLLAGLAAIGTAAMLWVGGSILVHGMAEHGLASVEHFIHDWSVAAAGVVHETAATTVGWLAATGMQAMIGIVAGLIVIPIATKVLAPAFSLVFRSGSKA
jgi:predicted DNA repair protein MutK